MRQGEREAAHSQLREAVEEIKEAGETLQAHWASAEESEMDLSSMFISSIPSHFTSSRPR